MIRKAKKKREARHTMGFPFYRSILFSHPFIAANSGMPLYRHFFKKMTSQTCSDSVSLSAKECTQWIFFNFNKKR
jgi:hypothetical protein